MNLLERIAQRAQMEDAKAYVDRVNHECHPCEFATWVGTGYFCPYQKCFRHDPFYRRWKERQRMRSVMHHGKADGA